MIVKIIVSINFCLFIPDKVYHSEIFLKYSTALTTLVYDVQYSSEKKTQYV